MKTIVLFSDGSIEAHCRADDLVARGLARYATAAEHRSYEAAFERDDSERIGEDMAMGGDSGPSQPSYDY